MKIILRVLLISICFNLFISINVTTPKVLAKIKNNINTTVFDQKKIISKISKYEAYIPKGVEIPMKLFQTITGEHSHHGDIIKFITTKDIVIKRVIIIPKGALVYGRITYARRPGRLGLPGKLDFMIYEVDTLNNVKVPLSYTSEIVGNTNGASTSLAFLGILCGFFTNGSDAIVKEGTEFEVPVKENTDLNVPWSKLADIMHTSIL